MTADLTGFASLEQCYAEQRERGWGTERHAQILECLGRAVGRLNGARRQHGCLYPKHLFVSLADGPPSVALIDLEKSRRRLTRAQAARICSSYGGAAVGEVPCGKHFCVDIATVTALCRACRLHSEMRDWM